MSRSCPTCGQPLRALQRVPYNPAALDQIRAGASAATLGWDQSFYENVCRKHGLAALPSPEPSNRPVVVEVVTSSAAPAPKSPSEPPMLGQRAQVTAAVPKWIAEELKRRAEKLQTSMSTLGRKIVLRACAGEPLKAWRREGDSAKNSISMILSQSQAELISATSKRYEIEDNEFIRRALAAAFASEASA